MLNRVGLECSSLPDKDALLNAYWRLYHTHPKYVLRLETELPYQLRRESRDEYRIIVTMILSEETADYDLSIALGKFFSDHPDMDSLKRLGSWDEARSLLKRYGFRTGGYRAKRNVDRFFCLKEHYFNRWNATFPPSAIDTLQISGNGYGPKFTRALRAYWKGERTVLPLDGKALMALHAAGLYEGDRTGGKARGDIESKLKTEIPLIDFHELLRFWGQTGGRDPGHFDSNDIRVIIGWNAWRLLCSNEREQITQDWEWIHSCLVNDEGIAKELWYFFRKIAAP